jgi:hypothetical protein
MLMRNISPSPARRFAAGIDVGPREVRLVIVSRTRREKWPVGVEWMGVAPLPAGVMCGVHLVDRAAVSAALSSLSARWPRRRAMRSMSCAMAVPGGMAAGAMAEGTLHLEARVEAAAAAGIALATVDTEPHAALRALVHAAQRTLRPNARFVVLWAGYDGIYGWRAARGAVRASIRFPGGGHADLESALRVLAGNEGIERALVGGDVALLERIGLALPDIGECLGCTVAPFECTSFRANGAALGKCADWRRAAGFAAAFGSALRGVSE